MQARKTKERKEDLQIPSSLGPWASQIKKECKATPIICSSKNSAVEIQVVFKLIDYSVSELTIIALIVRQGTPM